MKKVALSVAALALTAGSALAADLPSRKGPPMLPPPPPPPMWTGFYVGLNAGGTWANSNNISTVAAPIAVPSAVNPAAWGPLAGALALSASSFIGGGNNGGFIGGGQVGYNWQFYNSFVVGIEADIQGIAGSRGNNVAAVSGAPVAGFPPEAYTGVSTARRSVDYLGTVRGRLGWLFTPTLLLYGTGGLAYGGVNLNTAFVGIETPTFAGGAPIFGGTAFSDTRVGWTAGGGIEWMFLPNWSAKVEYLYFDLGNVTANGFVVHTPGVLVAGPIAAAATQTTTRFNGNIVRAGLNYHFNWGAPAPVIAKY